ERAARSLMPLPLLPHLGQRAVVADELPGLVRAGAGPVEAAGRLELGAVPDLAKGRRPEVAGLHGEVADVVLAEERAAAGRDTAVVVDDGLLPEEPASRGRARVPEEAVLAHGTPFRPDRPPLVAGELHAALVR